ncbi:MAG: hypothetical protein ACLP9L_00400 [Thermoguttaceae bacterium]
MKSLICRLSFVAAMVGLISLSAAFSADREKPQDVVDTAKSAGNSKSITKVLAIPARRQWHDNEGYCGETCIQSFAMYYGAYISQYQVRAMINSDQEHELVICENEDVVLKNLHMTYQQWDYDKQPTPQCKAYLAWTKQQLRDGHPVIGTAYMKGETDPDYDHILPFIGFQSSHDSTEYYDDDKLIFCDNYARSRFTRRFRTMDATRSDVAKGTYAYYIPRSVDYGCSITGIVDSHHETAPVQLNVDRWDEPDVVAGEKPVMMHGTLTIKALAPGKVYSLLRYDDYHKVPHADFLAKGGYAWRHRFTATGTTQTVADTFMSNDCVIYRCVAD